jgi:hypothetical protein
MKIEWKYKPNDERGFPTMQMAQLESWHSIAEQLAELNENIKNLKSVKVSVAK